MESNDRYEKILADAKAAYGHLTKAVELMSKADMGEPERARYMKLVTQARGKIEDVTAALSMGVGVLIGSRGGQKTAERGPEYYRQIAAMRKTKAGGRPRKES